MKQLTSYITEKLKIDKKVNSDKYIYFIIYSKGTKDTYHIEFDKKEDASDFIKNLKNPIVYLDGYKVPADLEEVIKYKFEEESTDNFIKYTKDQNFERFFG